MVFAQGVRGIRGLHTLFALLSLMTALVCAPGAHAQEQAAPKPSVGGHLGFALPIVTFGEPETTAIGSDFVNLGITPGITVHLTEHWSVDFEFIAFNRFKGNDNLTTFVVDPGVVYGFGSCAAGLRVATEVGAPTNIGIVPIFVKPFELGRGVSWFAELDLPVFFRDDGSSMKPSLTLLFQSGFGF